MDRKQIDGLIEARLTAMRVEQDALVKCWQPFTGAVDRYLKETQDRIMTDHERRTVSQCLENALRDSGIKSRSKLFEATTEDNIAFLGIQLPVIAALLPSLVLNDIAMVQALDRRIGAVFFLDVHYASNKGAISVGDTMISATTGHDRTVSGRRYASTMVKDEALANSASQLAGTVLTAYVAYAPGVNITLAGSIIVRDANGDNIGDDSASAGTIVGSGITTGSMRLDGLYSLTLAANTDSNGLTIDYEYQYDRPYDAECCDYIGVPEADINVRQETITAKDFPIRSKYSIGAAMDLQKAHGINLENEIVKYLGGEIRWTIDHYGIDLIDDASYSAGAAAAITPWNASIGTGQEWLWKKHEILDRFEEGNNNIIAATLRAVATFIVAGNNVARVIKQLPSFKPVANLNKQPPTGPHKIGTLDNRTVIQDPFLKNIRVGGVTYTGTDRYIMGYRGDNFLMAGFVYAPYIPLFATPTLVTSDLFAQKGFLSACGFHTINQGMFTYGRITNLGV